MAWRAATDAGEWRRVIVSAAPEVGRLFLSQLELETSSTVSAERRSQICFARQHGCIEHPLI